MTVISRGYINFLFPKLIDELGSALCSGNKFDILATKSDLEHVLKQQLILIAMSLDAFVQLNASIRVIPIIIHEKKNMLLLFYNFHKELLVMTLVIILSYYNY